MSNLTSNYIDEIESLLKYKSEGDKLVCSSIYLSEDEFKSKYPNSIYGIKIPIDDAIEIYLDRVEGLTSGRYTYDEVNY